MGTGRRGARTGRPRRAHRAPRRAHRRDAGQPADHGASSRSTPRCCSQGVATSRMVSTVFDGVARHTPEGHAFVAEAREHGFRDAVKQPRRALRRRTAADVRGLTGGPRSARMTARSVVLRVLLGANPACAHRGRTDPCSQRISTSRKPTLWVALTRMVSAGDLVRSEDGYRLSDRLAARQRRQDDADQPAANGRGTAPGRRW